MSIPILATKLYIPPPRPNIVTRSRLIERLDEGLSSGRRLTLISASAGFGKTTLVSAWAAGCGRPVTWLSLNDRDNDPACFLTYFVAALQTIAPNIGAGALAALQSLPLSAIEPILTALLNEIAAVPDNFILVLDDYHVIDAKPVENALAFLLEHLPPRMHLVLATREDPPLPLSRLRARGSLTELRAADLQFTTAEAAEFLNQVMGLNLSAEDIVSLENHTEGWIAGLQLAALSMQGHQDVSGFIQSFTGSHRFVLDYLVEEVLQQQSESVQIFLLRTSILDRMCGILCDAVTGREDGGEMLESLERGNLFVVPLDDKRRWYRYHHLFADVLQAHLLEAESDRVSALHRRASEWYERNSLPSDAIRHALAADDLGRAAGLIELAGPAMEGSPQASAWFSWVRALPDELVRARPVLSVWYAYALLTRADMEAAESRLKDAEQWLANPSPGMVVVDERQFQSLPAIIAVARAYHAQALGDVPGTVQYAQRALDLLPEGDHNRRLQTTGLLGLTCWANGDLEAAGRVFADYNARLRTARNIPDATGTAFVLADIRMAQGHLREAEGTLVRSLQFVMDQGGPLPPDAAELYRGLSELYRERGDLESAAQYLSRSEDLGGQAERLGWQYHQCVAQALLKQIRGDLDGALDLLYEAERLYMRTPLPVVRPITAMKARIWVAQGRQAEALGWARERGLSVDDDLSYMREFEHLTLARILLARYRNGLADSIRETMGLLERLLQAAEESGRIGSVIEILVLQALAHEAKGDTPPALASLERALILAEPEGYVRIFADEGPSMAGLLTRMNDSRKSGTPGMEAYIHKLLAAFEKQTLSGTMQGKPSRPLGISPGPSIEPLSEREREVMRLLGTELKGPEIARKLFISLNTLRTHTKSIFSKLGVNNRLAAVRYARELDLL
ncbi:MAG: helix-turn-helix transcriptional regulator [Spirochaetales bacterium]|nr:MAG: helix-turn-helix transcriptional regulator [Spirochaetales bacterium]